MTRKIVVVADTNDRARDLANGLGFPDAYKISTRSRYAGRGIAAHAILVDEASWPIPEGLRATLACCLAATGGSMYRISAEV